jgi:tetratricopeptide (TPR) repeat protein
LAITLSAAALAELPLRRAYERAGNGDVPGADSDFHLASSLRPWDGDVATQAAHAFSVLTADQQNPEIGGFGGRWSAQALQWFPESPAVLADAALIAETQGDFSRANRLADKALSLDPANPDLLVQRGVLAARLGAPADAERFFLSATAAAPNSPLPWRNLEHLFRLTDRADDAEAAAERASQLTSGVRD